MLSCKVLQVDAQSTKRSEEMDRMSAMRTHQASLVDTGSVFRSSENSKSSDDRQVVGDGSSARRYLSPERLHPASGIREPEINLHRRVRQECRVGIPAADERPCIDEVRTH